MAQDYFGNVVATTEAAHIAAIHGFTQGLLSYERTLLDILKRADEDTPETADTLTQSYAAVLWLLSETAGGAGAAGAYVDKARHGLSRALPREAAFFGFVEAWTSGDIDLALTRSEDLIAQFPRDLTAIKLRQYIDFNLGRFTELLRIGLIAQRAAPEVAYVHGMVAFGYEQCHLLGEAETSARHALSLKHNEPWAQHALAHVMLTQGRIDEGAQFLDSVCDQWPGLNSFIYTHLWWHQALFKLSQGHESEALDIYDRHVWGVDKTYSQDQVGAVSLLARLELSGLEVGSRWDDVAAYLITRGNDVVEPFLSLQYLYGLARAGRAEAHDLLTAIRHKTQTAHSPSQRAWRDCALPLAQGIVAFLGYRPAEAVHLFRQGMPWLSLIGGSHAQRDLFEQIELAALIQAGDYLAAQQKLEIRRACDPYGVPLNRQLALVYQHLGLPDLAEAALKRLRERQVSHKECRLWE